MCSSQEQGLRKLRTRRLGKKDKGRLMTKQCFVISAIGEAGTPTRERADRVRDHIIRPAAKECGYIASRADELDDPGMITTHMIQRLIDDPLVIADLTEYNPNVFYELAIRHSIGKPLVQFIQKGQTIPFNISGMRVLDISWNDTSAVENAKQRIITQIRSLEAGAVMQTPVSVAQGQRASKRGWAIWQQGEVSGKRLFEYADYYPIDLERVTNLPSVNADRYHKAVKHFLKDEHDDKLAAVDLVFLREDNLVPGKDDILKSATSSGHYKELVRKYDLMEFIEDIEATKQRLFRNYIRLVDDLGNTLKGVYFEILLHNVMNPIRSIIAVRNSEELSKRKLHDPSTRFVVQFVKDQGRNLYREFEKGSKVAYLKQFNHTKEVKATTTPIYHPRYGLIGILCANIDIDAIKRLDEAGEREFFENYIRIGGETPDFEK
jgi:hypothetical protein